MMNSQNKAFFIKVARIIDKYVGYFIILLLLFFSALNFSKLFRKENSFKNVKKILVIRLWAMGDSILTLPMIKKLKDHNYSVDVLATSRNSKVFQSVSFIDHIFLFDNPLNILKLIKKYDVVIDTEQYFNISSILAFFLGKKSIGFKGLFRDKLYTYKIEYNDKTHAVINFCNLLTPLRLNFVPDKLVPLEFSKDDENYVNKIINVKNKTHKLIGIHASTAETAPWRAYKLENYAKLINLLLEKEYIIYLTGTQQDYQLNENIIQLVDSKNKNKVINLAGKLSLTQLSYLLTKTNFFISADTGPMHLAAAMGTKTIGLFGPNLPERYAPYGKNNVAIYKAKNLSCSPCIDVHKGIFRKCKINGRCMDLITPEEILKKIKE